jgi:hypothetical protein
LRAKNSPLLAASTDLKKVDCGDSRSVNALAAALANSGVGAVTTARMDSACCWNAV